MKKILLLLANGFEILEAGVFTDVLGWNLVEGSEDTEVYTCGIIKGRCGTTYQGKRQE